MNKTIKTYLIKANYTCEVYDKDDFLARSSGTVGQILADNYLLLVLQLFRDNITYSLHQQYPECLIKNLVINYLDVKIIEEF